MRSFLVQLSCCICPECVGFEYGTWGISYLCLWSCFVDTPSILCTDCYFVLIARRKVSALWSLCARIISALPCMTKNPINMPLVSHIPEALYIVVSLQWTLRHQPLCWSAHTTVDWLLRLGETCRRRVPDRRWLQTDTGLISVPLPFLN